jgi:uncharacterized protein (UPF0305 family)
MQQLGKYIILAGIALLVIGILIYFAGNKLHWIGNLPGDIKIEKENFKFYFPITTMIILSALITLIVKLFHWFR